MSKFLLCFSAGRKCSRPQLKKAPLQFQALKVSFSPHGEVLDGREYFIKYGVISNGIRPVPGSSLKWSKGIEKAFGRVKNKAVI